MTISEAITIAEEAAPKIKKLEEGIAQEKAKTKFHYDEAQDLRDKLGRAEAQIRRLVDDVETFRELTQEFVTEMKKHGGHESLIEKAEDNLTSRK